LAHFRAHEPKGEFVMVIEGYNPKDKSRDADDEIEE
jgi:hypothetical protein